VRLDGASLFMGAQARTLNNEYSRSPCFHFATTWQADSEAGPLAQPRVTGRVLTQSLLEELTGQGLSPDGSGHSLLVIVRSERL
jgi:hypothetical protein